MLLTQKDGALNLRKFLQKTIFTKYFFAAITFMSKDNMNRLQLEKQLETKKLKKDFRVILFKILRK